MNLKGTVRSNPDSKGFLFVQMGIIRSKVHISDLELVDEPVINTPGLSRTGAGKIRMSKSTSVSTEINILGKTVDEAVAELDKYLDDAYLAHLKSVRICLLYTSRDKLIEQLKGTFGKYYDYHRRDIAVNEMDYLNVEDSDVFSHRAWELKYQREQEMRRNQPARAKKKSYDMEL